MEPAPTQDGLTEFEEVVLSQAPPGAVIIGAELSPGGMYGASLTMLPSAGGYLMDDVFQRVGSLWEGYGGGSGGGYTWTRLDDDQLEDDDAGVLRFGGEAPEDATVAVVRFGDRTHRVPVRHGHFLFVAWSVRWEPDEGLPEAIAFE